MGSIKNIPGMPQGQGPRKNEGPAGARKTGGEKAYDLSKSADRSASQADKAEISSTARELLNLKIAGQKYLPEIRDAKPYSRQEIEEIRRKVAEDYYDNPEVIEDIVERLVELPNFLTGIGDRDDQ